MYAFAVMQDTQAVTEIELPTPEPAGREVLLRVVRSGVCHSDAHLREGFYDLGEHGRLQMTDRGLQYPLVMGHEVVGVVEAVGSQVTNVAEGEVRLVFPWLGCGTCATCVAGQENACQQGRNLGIARPGGYAEHILVPDERYLLDVDGIDQSWAATLACSGLTAYSASRKVLPLDPAQPVVVIGTGGVGLTAVAALRALGHREICAVDRSERNLALAADLGATSTVVAGGSEVATRVTEATAGPAAAVIDFVNNTATVAIGFEVVRKAGHMVQVGLFGGEIAIPAPMLTLKMVDRKSVV